MRAFGLTIGLRVISGRAGNAKTAKARKFRPKGIVEAFIAVSDNLAGNAMISDNLLVQVPGSNFSIFTERASRRCMHHFSATVSEGNDTRVATSSG